MMHTGSWGTQTMPRRDEGFVLVALMALSTVIVLTMVGTACVVGCKHYRHYKHSHAQESCAESFMMEYDMDHAQQEARVLSVLG